MDGPAVSVVEDKLRLPAQDVLLDGLPGPAIPVPPLRGGLQNGQSLPFRLRVHRLSRNALVR